MNRKFFVGGVLAAFVIVGIAWFLLANNAGENGDLSERTPTDADFALLRSALEGSGSVECEFMDEHGNETTAMIRDGDTWQEIRTPQGDRVQMIWKDDTVWMWDTDLREGLTYRAVQDGEAGDEAREDILAVAEVQLRFCSEAAVGEDRFDVPDDVDFSGMNELE